MEELVTKEMPLGRIPKKKTRLILKLIIIMLS